jgi:protein-tyrosine phosphatase
MPPGCSSCATDYGQAFAEACYPMPGVQASFLQAGLDQATGSYGSMSGCITNGLGLSANIQSALTDKLPGD